MAEVAEREIARWPAGEPLPAWPTMQAITLEVIMRTVFGVHDGERLERLGNVLRACSRSPRSRGGWRSWPSWVRVASRSSG